jgi:hypothetical protein
MPTEKQKPSGSAKTAPSKSKTKASELRDDDLRTISGGMASGGAAGAIPPVCVSQT